MFKINFARIEIHVHTPLSSNYYCYIFVCCRLFNPFSAGTVFNIFPEQFKKAYIRPLLKKTLDKNDITNYRTVSNLSFISKIFEKVPPPPHLAYFPTWKQIRCLIICNQQTINSTPLNQLF